MTSSVDSSSTQLSTQAWQALATAYGIDTHYTDVFGNTVAAPTETLQAILAVLNVSPTCDAEAYACIDEQRHTQWQQFVPNVITLRDDAETLTVRLPKDAVHVAWALTTEAQQHASGEWSVGYFDGLPTHTLPNGTIMVEHQLTLPPALRNDLPWGYHQLSITVESETTITRLIRVPNRCYNPSPTRSWGVALQLYAQRSATNAGIGNLKDLAQAAQWLGQRGANLVGLNPMHALFPSRPGHISPYSPSSRRFLNTLYIDVTQTPEWASSPAAQAIWNQSSAQRAEWQASNRVPYEALTPWHQRLLVALFDTFTSESYRTQHPQRHATFEAFCNQQGPSLWQFALFQVLSEVMDAEAGHITCWWQWPTGYQSPNTPDIKAFGERYATRIRAAEYTQFLAWEQLQHAQSTALNAGMALGLYGDLAVGSDSSGFDVWANPSLISREMSVGCPPDACNLLGQNWGLPAWRQDVLAQQQFEPFIDLLKANMSLMGAIRIDHAMSLMRLFWIPQGKTGAEGTYVQYPLETMMALVALESHRNQCVVIGEDLGTVPPEIGHAFDRWGILSYKLMLFERSQEGGFMASTRYTNQALTAFSTHDLPTLAGFWSGHDIETRKTLGLYPSEDMCQLDWARRPEEKQHLINALNAAGLWNDTYVPDTWSPALAAAMEEFLAQSPCQLLVMQLEDLMGETSQANMPGTVNEHPNWCQKLPVPLEAWGNLEGLTLAITRCQQQRQGAALLQTQHWIEEPANC